VRSVPGQGVQVERERCDQGLAFARLHLGDLALVQHHSTDELHIVVTQANGARGGFADRSKSPGQDLFHRRGFRCLELALEPVKLDS
jgi:hypothetical protein